MSAELNIGGMNLTGELKLQTNATIGELEIEDVSVSDELELQAQSADELSILNGAEIYKERLGTTSYEMLTDLPSLDGKTIIRDMYEKDPTVPLWAKTTSKPVYDSEEVGVSAISIEELETLWNNL